MSAPPSQRFGPYELLSPLGAGGMGVVYRARDTRLGRDVAIKLLPQTFSTDPDRLRRFQHEAEAAAALNHPNIMAVFDIGTTDEGAPYIVSELLEGVILRHYLHDGPLPLRKVIAYGGQVASGLAAAHERGIIHRDLKPENIFVTRDEHVKILDFGLAKLMDEPQGCSDDQTITIPEGATLPGVVLGTVGYMSPEQVRGQACDTRTDIFSFGLILYEMLAGKPAFKAATDADTQAEILRGEPEPLGAINSSVPPGLEQLVWHCLEKEPQRRFQSASDIAFSLQAFSTAGSAPSGVSRAAAPLPKYRWPTVALAAAAVVLGVVGFLIGLNHARIVTPKYQQLTYQPGVVRSARISPDGLTVLCAARFGKGFQLYSIRFDSVGVRPLEVDADEVPSISSKGEAAVLQGWQSLAGATGVGFLARVPLGGGAPKMMLKDVQSADWSPDGEQMATARYNRDRRVYQLEYPTGKVLYETTGWIARVRVSADGRSIAFIDHPAFGDDAGYVAVIASAGGTVRRLSRLWGDVRGLAWDPKGEVWFSAADVGFNYALYAVTQSGKSRQVLTVPGGVVLNDIAKDGKVLVTDTVERTIIMVSTQRHPEEQNLAWLDDTEFFRFSEDGAQILMGDESSASGTHHASFLRNVDGSSAVKVGEGDGIALSPDGEWVLSRIPPDELVLLPTGAGEIRRLSLSAPSTDPSGEHASKTAIRADLPAEWLPDGKSIVYVGDDSRTHLLDLQGKDTALTPAGTSGYLPTADGRSVLVRTAKGDYELYPVGGGNPSPFPYLQAGDQPVRFSSDGKDIFVRNSVKGVPGINLYRVKLTNGTRSLLWHLQVPKTTLANEITVVDVTPDGTGYAYGYSQESTVLYSVSGLK